MNDDIEAFKLGKLNSKRYIDKIDKESDERNQMNIIYDKESVERYQIGKNYEYRLTDNIDFLKLRTLIPEKKYIEY